MAWRQEGAPEGWVFRLTVFPHCHKYFTRIMSADRLESNLNQPWLHEEHGLGFGILTWNIKELLTTGFGKRDVNSRAEEGDPAPCLEAEPALWRATWG